MTILFNKILQPKARIVGAMAASVIFIIIFPVPFIIHTARLIWIETCGTFACGAYVYNPECVIKHLGRVHTASVLVTKLLISKQTEKNGRHTKNVLRTAISRFYLFRKVFPRARLELETSFC